MCNASGSAKQAAQRNTQIVDCSKGAADRTFNNTIFEIATFNLDDNGDASPSSSTSAAKQNVLRSSLTVKVLP
jgi:flagellar basal body L-ring protein FlgH